MWLGIQSQPTLQKNASRLTLHYIPGLEVSNEADRRLYPNYEFLTSYIIKFIYILFFYLIFFKSVFSWLSKMSQNGMLR